MSSVLSLVFFSPFCLFFFSLSDLRYSVFDVSHQSILMCVLQSSYDITVLELLFDAWPSGLCYGDVDLWKVREIGK